MLQNLHRQYTHSFRKTRPAHHRRWHSLYSSWHYRARDENKTCFFQETNLLRNNVTPIGMAPYTDRCNVIRNYAIPCTMILPMVCPTPGQQFKTIVKIVEKRIPKCDRSRDRWTRRGSRNLRVCSSHRKHIYNFLLKGMKVEPNCSIVTLQQLEHHLKNLPPGWAKCNWK